MILWLLHWGMMNCPNLLGHSQANLVKFESVWWGTSVFSENNTSFRNIFNYFFSFQSSHIK